MAVRLVTKPNLYQRIRNRTYELFDDRPYTDLYDATVSFAVMGLIIVNIIALCLESIPAFSRRYSTQFQTLESVSVWIFTIEYLLRVWSIVDRNGFKHPIKGRIRYILNPISILDLASILPAYLTFFGIDLRFIRVFRTFRIFRIAKLTRYSHAFKSLGRVVLSKKEELIAVLFLQAVLLVAISFTIFLVEHDAQPRAFSNVPAALHWATAALMGVGSKHIEPITPVGRLISGVVAVLGLGLFALPAAILSSAFLEHYRRADRDNQQRAAQIRPKPFKKAA